MALSLTESCSIVHLNLSGNCATSGPTLRNVGHGLLIVCGNGWHGLMKVSPILRLIQVGLLAFCAPDRVKPMSAEWLATFQLTWSSIIFTLKANVSFSLCPSVRTSLPPNQAPSIMSLSTKTLHHFTISPSLRMKELTILSPEFLPKVTRLKKLATIHFHQ